MTRAAEQGSELILTTDGIDEQVALEELRMLFETGFGEL